MTEAEIMEAFIRAAEIEMKMPKTGEAPRKDGNAYLLPWYRTDADKRGWRKEIGDQLHRGDNPLDEERQDFTNGKSSRVLAADVTHWETCLRWTMELLDDPRERRALWAWSFAMAGAKPFSKWCRRIERIHPNTGRDRKNRAVGRISRELVRGGALNVENGSEPLLHMGPVFGESADTIADDAPAEKRTHAWAADGAFTRIFSDGDDDFSWSDRRNELRRKRQERKRPVAAA